MPAEDNQYAKLLVDRKHLLNDIGRINYCDSTESEEGFSRPKDYFCDNVVFWTLCHDHSKNDEKKSFVTTNAIAIGSVRAIVTEYLDKPNPKYIGRGKDHDPDTTRQRIHREKKAALKMGKGKNPEYVPGYIATKISLSKEMTLHDVQRFLAMAEDKLRENSIVLHDIDIACDCTGITTRKLVEEYLVANDVSIQKVLPDKSKVGNDCISWMDTKGQRCKVYNKFVQMLQSCDVRKPLGSLVADLICNHDPNFAKKLLEYRDEGMTRIEMTIYSSRICHVEWYEKRMDRLLDFLDECPVHKVSFDDQWGRIAQRLTSVLAMHVTKSNSDPVFVYSHWWNSVTGKLQGYARKDIKRDDVEKILANFSFNDRPLYFVGGKLDKKGNFKVIEESTWRRKKGCDVITLVPGPGRGLYPSYRDIKRKALAFEDVGLGTVANITLGWPKRSIDRRSKPLAKISKKRDNIPKEDEIDESSGSEEEDETYRDENLREINISAEGRFISAHSFVKKEGAQTLTIVAFGRRQYYGRLTTYLMAKDGSRIISTYSLQNIVEEEIVHGVYFDVRLLRAIEINGYRDVECMLV